VILCDTNRLIPLSREQSGYFSGFTTEAAAGSRYKYRIDSGASYPDPVSRFQPAGPHRPSQVIDPDTFHWSDDDWPGLGLSGQAIYEMHAGTFTPEGTWNAAAEKLAFLRDTGVTVLELMPVSEFPGEFGWGYDGVHPFAPTHLYGTPDDFRRFVDRAHSLGLGVILDVVYNHLGPDGNYFGMFSTQFHTDRYTTDWGAAINYDSLAVRELIVSNAAYWIHEFHLDGLRLDATEAIHDCSNDHIVAALTREARKAGGRRGVLIVAENDMQETRFVRPPEQGGYSVDMLWNNDYHHAAMAALSGRNPAYYSHYRGAPQEFISAMKYGYLFQGQCHAWRRGSPTFGVPPAAFVVYLENHDQISNSAHALRSRALSDPGSFRAITALTLLGPCTPMLFQGQEFGATSPFFFFADHVPELRRRVYQGRLEFMSHIVTAGDPEMHGCIPDPGDRRTFELCKIDWSELQKNGPVHRLHRDLLRLRREDAVLRAQRPIDGAVLNQQAFVLRYFGEHSDDRLLIVNLGMDLRFDFAPEPLLAPVAGEGWTIEWSSESPAYGGGGTPPFETGQNWTIPGRAAILLKPAPQPAKPPVPDSSLDRASSSPKPPERRSGRRPVSGTRRGRRPSPAG
jgi:maltooligosyltrehalose trehalohydrolase